MANNSGDDFLHQIMEYQTYGGATEVDLAPPMMVQLSSGGGYHGGVFPLGLSLAAGEEFVNMDEPLGITHRFPDDVAHGHLSSSSSMNYAFSGQPVPSTVAAVPHPPAIRPRVRARRGQATDPHSIAERVRRGRIAERDRALRDLVPSVNKTDRAVMLDEIVEYVKFLTLQVKVLRVGGAGAVAPLVRDIPVSSIEDEINEGGIPAWEKWSSDGTEKQVAKLMEENVGAAMQFLQSKGLCIMPISLASAIYDTQPPVSTSVVKPETHPSS